MGHVKPKQPLFRKRGSTYSSREMEEEYEEFDKRDRGQRDMAYVETFVSRTISYRNRSHGRN